MALRQIRWGALIHLLASYCDSAYYLASFIATWLTQTLVCFLRPQICAAFTFTVSDGKNPEGCCYLKSWSRTPLTSFPKDVGVVGGQTFVRISPPNVVPCYKQPSYQYNETAAPYKCTNDCECGGTRVCSTYGYCGDREIVRGGRHHPLCSKLPDYTFPEAPPYTCRNECECSGRRVCSSYGYCANPDASNLGRRALKSDA